MTETMTASSADRTNRSRMDSYWMPFTANTAFKADPRLVSGAKGMYFKDTSGRDILDAMAGLWCVNLGHCHPKIVEAIRKQAGELDYAQSFQFGHQGAFELANSIADMAPGDLNQVFFTNSGSEAVDTALKIALAYFIERGEGQRTHLVGRSRGYHGMGFGGLSVAGIGAHRRAFGPLLPGVAHLPHTLDLERNALSKGLPDHGAELADRLEEIVQIHGSSTIAAVIVEPVAGSTGVLIPPRGYLQRLREICDKYGILLIFDEVITGFGRLGASFAAEYFGVQPDIITCAKGLTNGSVPMGGVIVREEIYQTFMRGSPGSIELMHGYTYSGHPLAAAAGLAALEAYQSEGIFQRVAELAPYWEERAHSLRGAPHVIDIRNLGLVAAIQLDPHPDGVGKRAKACWQHCYDHGVMPRANADIIILSPPLIISKDEIDRIFDTISDGLKRVD